MLPRLYRRSSSPVVANSNMLGPIASGREVGRM
jgi:hypothetical protein